MRSTGIKQWSSVGGGAEVMPSDFSTSQHYGGQPNEMWVEPHSTPAGFSTGVTRQEGMSRGLPYGRSYQGGVFRDRSRARLAAQALNNRIEAGRKHWDAGREWEDTD